VSTTAIHAPYRLSPRIRPASTGVTMSVAATSDWVAPMTTPCRSDGTRTDNAATNVGRASATPALTHRTASASIGMPFASTATR
jgi:hypothetical protein